MQIKSAVNTCFSSFEESSCNLHKPLKKWRNSFNGMSMKHSEKPLEIRISTIPAVSIFLHDTDLDAITIGMQEITVGAEDYFDHDLAVIDLSKLEGKCDGIDWQSLLVLLRAHRLNPVAVRGAPSHMEAELRAYGLSLDATAKPRPVTQEAPPPEIAPPPPAAPPQPIARKSMIVDTPVRTGQRIYARDADLIVMAAVNSGAEVIADGSIHVYGPLRGRALAGARGDTSSRIFTLGMEAELVSIAGIYNTFEHGFPAETKGRPKQIRLSGDRIEVSAIEPDSR